MRRFRSVLRVPPLTAALVAVCASALLGAVLPGSIAPAAAQTPRWTLIGVDDVSSAVYTQGLAGGRDGVLRGRGYTSIRPEVAVDGWTHIGDGDLHAGRMYDAYENLGARRKLYTITAPDGALRRYYHRLIPGEAANNSFVTVSPDGRYLVSGEWGAVDRLLVFANPVGRPDGADLALAGTIDLDRPLTDVQSCDFLDASTLICASDTPEQAVYTVRLAHPLGDGLPVRASVHREFALPHRSACRGGYEAEGIDYDAHRKVLSVAVIDPAPCLLNTKIFRYRRTAATH